MSKGENKNTGKLAPASKPATRQGAKKVLNTEAENHQPPNAGQPETNSPQTENKPKAVRSKPKATPPVAEPDSQIHQEPVPETTDMEVHHHPQLEHKPKPFKEYLLEGFMIFIAVMMGFIAENIREAIDNHEHVQQLTSQLVRDLKADTAEFNEIHKGETKIKGVNDTLLYLLKQPLQKADTRRIQKLIADAHSMWVFHPSAGAVAAIKNELHLKQFSSSEIMNYFAGYERRINLLHAAQDINLQYQRLYLDPFITQHFTPDNMAAAFAANAMPTAQMRNLTQNDLDQLAVDIVLIRIVTEEMIKKNARVKEDALAMLKYVTQHYDLDEK